MKNFTIRLVLAGSLLAIMGSAALAQAWRAEYEKGLRLAKDAKWTEARAAYQAAAAARADVSGPTSLPGPATDQRLWRDGAPYSPNFLAAYSLYRIGLAASGAEQTATLKAAAAELEALIAKRQYSRETLFFLNQIYAATGDSAARLKLETTFTEAGGMLNWKVDTDGIIPEDNALVAETFSVASAGPSKGEVSPIVKPTGGSGNPTLDPAILGPVIGRVPAVASKFALIIGNSESKLPDGAVPFAGESVEAVRKGVTENGGYPDSNVKVLQNATAAQILAAAGELADRMNQDSTVLIFFAGAGYNLAGKDYLAGVDAAMATDTGSMLAKTDLFLPFVKKGAHVFSFFEVSRPVLNGTFFGLEAPQLGIIAQTFGTIRGEQAMAAIRDGKSVGVFADAIASVLKDLKSNSVPVLEFGWQVFYKMRRGLTGTTGGGGLQTPTLPMLSNMAANARF